MRFERPTPEQRQIAWLWCVAALASIALRPVWLELAPFAPACPFRALTGVPCPACGSTHAAVATLHGAIGAALAANPLAAVAGLAFLLGGVIAPIWAAFAWPLPQLPAPLPRWARALIAAALAANWAWVIARS